METVFDQIVRTGAFINHPSLPKKDVRELNSLVDQGLVVCVKDIPHHPDTLNPDYTFVTNDERGLH